MPMMSGVKFGNCVAALLSVAMEPGAPVRSMAQFHWVCGPAQAPALVVVELHVRPPGQLFPPVPKHPALHVLVVVPEQMSPLLAPPQSASVTQPHAPVLTAHVDVAVGQSALLAQTGVNGTNGK